MKILFLTPFLPSPPRAGGMMRLHGLLTSLAETHSVSILSFIDRVRDHTEEIEATREYCDELVVLENDRVGLGGRQKRLLQLRSLASPRSFEYHVYVRDEFQRTLDEMVKRNDYDVVNAALTYMGWYRLPENAVRVLDEHNIEFDILKRTAESESEWFRKFYSEVNYRKLRREEIALWRSFDGCTVTSSRDESILRSHVEDVSSSVVPNGVDTSLFVPAPEQTEPRSLVFVGANYYPNIRGIEFFLRDVMPRLRERYEDFRLYIVGEVPPETLQPYLADDVILTGYVEDIRAWIARAGAVIVPLFVGGGTRLKVLEAMSMAKPVISTTLGAEGIDVNDGENILLADNADMFVDQIATVFDDPVRSSRLGQAGRHLVESRYDWKISAERLNDFYLELMERGARAHRRVDGRPDPELAESLSHSSRPD